MTALRPTLTVATVLLLSALHPGIPLAQTFNPGRLEVSPTINATTTRVPSGPLPSRIGDVRILATVDRAAFAICNTGSVENHLRPDSLRFRLTVVLRGKTASEIQERIEAAEKAPNRIGKLARIFEIDNYYSALQSTPSAAFQLPLGEWTAPGGQDSAVVGANLQTGQEVTYTGPSCFTPAQIDEINAEGLRVMRAVRFALMGPGRR